MARKKRSEKLAEAAVRPARAPAAAPVVTERMLRGFCPVCGRTIPEYRAIKIGYVTVDRINYFGSIDWDPDKPFGVSYKAGGKNAYEDWHHINPEDAPEIFEAIKNRFIQAVGEWLRKGWMTKEELLEGT